jgi:catechol 2,3-dioxygenase-like lactoylglutathione lyase family enzyme
MARSYDAAKSSQNRRPVRLRRDKWGRTTLVAGKMHRMPEHNVSRREFVAALGALASFPISIADAQTGSLLPLHTPKVDHFDVIVPNVEASARFYMGVFNTKLHAQPFQGGFRYFVLLGTLPENRQVGYLAIGDSRGRGTYVGHFCTSVFDYRRDSAAIMSALADAVDKAGLGKISVGGGAAGIFSDPDGIEIQFLPAPDTLVTAAVPSDLVEPNKGLVTPLGVDHVLLHVSDLEKGVQFYRILYGKEAVRQNTPPRVWFQIGDTRLGLEQAPAGTKPRIAHFAVKVAAFDRTAVAAALTKLGATVSASPDEQPRVLRFRDPDGITVEITSP